LVNRKRLATARDLRLSFSHCEETRIPVRVNVDHVRAVLQQRNRCIGSVHFKHLVLSKISNAEVHLAFRKLELHGLIIQVQKAEAGLRPHPHYRDVQVQFGLGSLIGIQVVACSERAVCLCRNPIVYSRWFHGNASLDVIQPCDAIGRILLRKRRQREKSAKARGDSQSFCFCFKCVHHNGVSLQDRCSPELRSFSSLLQLGLSKTKLMG
jgi:hypothetical protein